MGFRECIAPKPSVASTERFASTAWVMQSENPMMTSVALEVTAPTRIVRKVWKSVLRIDGKAGEEADSAEVTVYGIIS